MRRALLIGLVIALVGLATFAGARQAARMVVAPLPPLGKPGKLQLQYTFKFD